MGANKQGLGFAAVQLKGILLHQGRCSDGHMHQRDLGQVGTRLPLIVKHTVLRHMGNKIIVTLMPLGHHSRLS